MFVKTVAEVNLLKFGQCEKQRLEMLPKKKILERCACALCFLRTPVFSLNTHKTFFAPWRSATFSKVVGFSLKIC